MKLILVIAIKLLFLSLTSSLDDSNFCKTILYPKDADFDKSVCEMVVSAGFKCETHQVITSDGYIMPQYRIVNPAFKTIGKPVLLVHGLLANAAYFIMNSPGNGTQWSKEIFNGQKVSYNLGYALAMNGYDVWLVSYRGDSNSMSHKTLNPNSPKFWEFSADERIEYDLPAIIDFIRTKNSSPKISYVGHSQGTTIIFGLLSSNPKYNDIIDIAVGLAPVGRLANTPSLYYKMLMLPPWPQMLYLEGGPLPLGYKANSDLLSNMSINCPLLNTALLPFMYEFITGPSSNLNKSRAHVYFKNLGGDSTWSGLRYLQHPDSIRHFDYGPLMNLLKYRSIIPPIYDLSKIKSKLCLFSGTNDYLVAEKDLNFVRKQLKQNVLVCDYVENGLSHLDFGLGMTMSNINLRILQLFSKYK